MSKEFDNIYNEYMDYTPDKYSDVCREIKGEIDNERTADKSNESLFGPLPEKQEETSHAEYMAKDIDTLARKH